MKHYYIPLLIAVFLLGCKKDTKTIVKPPDPTPEKVIASPEYIDNLLFVNSNNYQIMTVDSAASFSSVDTHIQISSAGVIKRLTSAEVVPIVIKWKNTSKPNTTIYALGAMDTNQDKPFQNYQGALATDPYASYLQGWKTLQKLPVTGETYAIVLRHADASFGIDFSVNHKYPGPANWWKSADSTLARQLNTQGVQRATELGQIFKDLKYPIKRVITSEFYRARQTASILNIGPAPTIDGRINHPAYTTYAPGLYQGMVAILAEQPIDNQMTLIVAHHPINELRAATGYPSFPNVSPFNWSAAYLIKIGADGSLTYEGAASWGMFKRWHDSKMN